MSSLIVYFAYGLMLRKYHIIKGHAIEQNPFIKSYYVYY